MAFEKAVLTNVKAKIAITGPSGSGKTYSSLALATGLANGGKIGFIDTEGDRGLYYSNKFDFYRDTLKNHSPEAYIDKIREAEAEGIDVLIIDSITHEWKQLLEDLEKIPGNNSYAKWGQITPRHEAFLKVILEAKLHIICTVRAKDKYVLEVNSRGKQVPKKVGLGLEQRDTIEYEFTTVLNIDSETHYSTASKDNTGVFKNINALITEEHGKRLFLWCTEGVDVEEQEIGLHKSILLEDFLEKKEIPEAEALKFILREYNSKEFKHLKLKHYKSFMMALKNNDYTLEGLA